MLKYGGDVVHAAVYHIILGVWHAESALADFKQDVVILIRKEGGQHRLQCILHHCMAEHGRQGMCPAHQGTPLGRVGCRSSFWSSFWSHSMGAGQTEAALMPSTAYACYVSELVSGSKRCPLACWTSPRPLSPLTEA